MSLMSLIDRFLTGIEFREAAFTISADSEAIVEAGMVFIVSIGVAPLGKEDSKKDTVQLIKGNLPHTFIFHRERLQSSYLIQFLCLTMGLMRF